MDEPEFFTPSGPFTLAEVAKAANAKLSGDDGRLISGIAALAQAGQGDITFLEDRRQGAALTASKASACLIKGADLAFVPPHMAVLEVGEPARARAIITGMLYPSARAPQALAAGLTAEGSALVDRSAKIEAGVRIEPGAVVGAGAHIGKGSLIAPNAVIGPHVRIGRDCYIGANCVIQHSLIGNRVIIHSGCYIGQDGFGYVMGANGHVKIPQIGRVIIQDDVEIGAATTIDRGALEDTIVGEGTKIDNQVQIAHNVVIGRYCVIAGKVGISGSCRIGDFVAIGGGAGLADHLTLGAGARIGAAAGLMHDVPAGQTWIGTPAKPARTFFREVALLSKLAADKKRRLSPGDEGDRDDA